VKDEAAHIATSCFTPSAVRDKPLINKSRISKGKDGVEQAAEENGKERDATAGKGKRKVEYTEQRGDISIWGLFLQGIDCIIDVRITNTDNKTYHNTSVEKILARQEREKKRKYLEACLEKR